jgi:hypothetical protein
MERQHDRKIILNAANRPIRSLTSRGKSAPCRPTLRTADFKWWPETGSNRRRRPFQGRLAMELSGLESADAIDMKDLRAAPIRIVWDNLGWFPPQLVPVCSRPAVRPHAVRRSDLRSSTCVRYYLATAFNRPALMAERHHPNSARELPFGCRLNE